MLQSSTELKLASTHFYMQAISLLVALEPILTMFPSHLILVSRLSSYTQFFVFSFRQSPPLNVLGAMVFFTAPWSGSGACGVTYTDTIETTPFTHFSLISPLFTSILGLSWIISEVRLSGGVVIAYSLMLKSISTLSVYFFLLAAFSTSLRVTFTSYLPLGTSIYHSQPSSISAAVPIMTSCLSLVPAKSSRATMFGFLFQP